MSNKIKALTIIFEESVSEEYIDMIQTSALCYKGVSKVERHIDDVEQYIANSKAKTELYKALTEELWKK